MAIIIRKIKSLNLKKTLSIVLLGGLGAMVLSTASVSAVGAAFNIFAISYTPTQNADLPLLDGRNASSGESFSTSQTDHDAGVSAGPDQIVELQVYFHNGAANGVDNKAHNVVIRAQANPTLGSAAFVHTISATISAADANTVSSANKGGNINIFISSAAGAGVQSLSLVPGSTFLFKNCGSPGGCQQSALPDTIFTGGVAIGDVDACFEFHGFVNFKVRVSQAQPPAEGGFTIVKQVRNVTLASPFSDTQVSVQPGQIVEFKIVVTASGGDVHSINARDQMDSQLTLSGPVTGSTGSQTFTFTSAETAAFFASGPGAGDIPNGQSRTILFQAQVANSGLTNGQILNNVAFAFTPALTKSENAQVVVSLPQAGNLAIKKYVRNISTSSAFADDGVAANPLNTVEYKIVVSVQNSAVPNVVVKDSKDNKLVLTGSVTLDQTLVDANAFFGSGISLGQVNPGANREIIFRALIAPAVQFTSPGTFVLLNTATAISAAQTVSDVANVTVTIAGAPQIVCTFVWEAPTGADGRGIRRVGAADSALAKSNVSEQVTGLAPNSQFIVVDQHVSGAPVFEDLKTADANGNFGPFTDRTPIPSTFVPGDYNVFIKVNGVKVADCKGFTIQTPSVQNLSIVKNVRNDSSNTGFANQVQAKPGDILTFQILVASSGSNITVLAVSARDALPAKLIFASNTLLVDGVNRSSEANSFFGSGITIGDLAPNTQKEIRFQANVASPSNFSLGCPAEVLVNRGVTESVLALVSPAVVIGPYEATATISVCKEAAQKVPGQPVNRPTT